MNGYCSGFCSGSCTESCNGLCSRAREGGCDGNVAGHAPEHFVRNLRQRRDAALLDDEAAKRCHLRELQVRLGDHFSSPIRRGTAHPEKHARAAHLHKLRDAADEHLRRVRVRLLLLALHHELLEVVVVLRVEEEKQSAQTKKRIHEQRNNEVQRGKKR